MYNYENQKKNIFTEKGQEKFIKVRDKAKSLLSAAGCFRMDAVISVACGDVWDLLACVDRMVEMGEIREVTNRNETAAQHRIFTSARS